MHGTSLRHLISTPKPFQNRQCQVKPVFTRAARHAKQPNVTCMTSGMTLVPQNATESAKLSLPCSPAPPRLAIKAADHLQLQIRLLPRAPQAATVAGAVPALALQLGELLGGQLWTPVVASAGLCRVDVHICRMYAPNEATKAELPIPT